MKVSSPGDEYVTPRWVWEPWHGVLGFVLDAAASPANKLPPCKLFYTKEDSAFDHNWALDVSAQWWHGSAAAWCNPPYSRTGGPLKKWVEKALEESRRGLVIAMLLPADTSTDWFGLLWDRDKGMWRDGVQGYFTDGRIRFIDPRTGEKTKGSPTFGSLVVVLSCFRNHF